MRYQCLRPTAHATAGRLKAHMRVISLSMALALASSTINLYSVISVSGTSRFTGDCKHQHIISSMTATNMYAQDAG